MPSAAASVRSPRTSRLAAARQTLVSLAVVLVGYWMYCLLVVPLIEPTVEEHVAETVSDQQIEEARADITRRQADLAQYFHPGDWEAQGPAIWQSGKVRLLFKTMTPTPDGTVELRPCTLMFFPDARPGTKARPIIMRTTEGANIQFDEKIDLKNVDPAKRKFVGGRLIGPIRVFQIESAPGAGDDLEIATRDIKLSSDKAWTAEPVNFRLGRSHGSGRDLEILFSSGKPGEQQGTLRAVTLHKMRLQRDVRMRLEMGSGPLAADAGGQPAAAQPAGEPPIEITCQGAFEFDMQEYAASFANRVDVFRLNPTGDSDQLNCELLTVYFSRPGSVPSEPVPNEPVPAQAGNRSAASQVRLIEARGNPVTMQSPSQAMYARCNGVDYVPGVGDAPGSLSAFGPGVIQGNLPNDPTGKFAASFARELRFEPEGSQYRVMLRGATAIQIGQMGEIKADEVFAWLSRKPKPAGPPLAQVAHQANRPAGRPGGPAADAWQVERVLAQRYPDAQAQTQGDVTVNLAGLDATAGVIEATIHRDAAGPPAAGGAAAPGANPGGAGGQNRPRQNPNERYVVAGRKVQIHLVPQGEQMTVAGATIETGAQLEQFNRAATTDVRALLVKGDRLHVTDAQTDDTRVTISGNPGYVEAGGMILWGAAIELEKRTNRLWIDGSGRLTLPMTQDFEGKPLARPQALTVDWKKRMDFQHDTAVFQGAVVARSAQQVVNTETLEAQLNRAIDFRNPDLGSANGQPAQRLDLAALRTHGLTFMESRQLDEQGQQTTFSQMEMRNLSVDRGTGKIAGLGPGWVKHVSRGAPNMNVPGQAPAEKPAADDKNQFTYLHVTFRKGIDGNLNQRKLKFFDRTKTIYAPVADWTDEVTAKDLAALGGNGMSLEAAELEVREMERRPDGKRGWFELDATGNVMAEGQKFTALGERLTYAERNEHLVLRGNPAELYRENDAGHARHETRTEVVEYWFATGRVAVNGGSLNLSVPQRQNNRPANPAAGTP